MKLIEQMIMTMVTIMANHDSDDDIVMALIMVVMAVLLLCCYIVDDDDGDTIYDYCIIYLITDLSPRRGSTLHRY